MEAGVYLKDKSGNPNNYGFPMQVQIHGYDWEGEEYVYKYTRITQLNSYVYQQEDGNYRILAKLDYLPDQNWFAFGLKESEFEQYGTYGSAGIKIVLVLVTPKYFEVGKVYTQAEFLGGL